jgi:hypothetical protein
MMVVFMVAKSDPGNLRARLQRPRKARRRGCRLAICGSVRAAFKLRHESKVEAVGAMTESESLGRSRILKQISAHD